MAALGLNMHKTTLIHITVRFSKRRPMMERNLFCVAVVVYLISTAVMALPSNAWASSGWTTESSLRSGWEKTEAKYSDTWNQATGGEASQGKGWVSSESAKDSKPKAIPTSWQQVDRHHGGSVKSSGWTNVGQKAALNPPSQDIANGFVVHHPVPSSNPWNQSPLPQESWNKQNSDGYWPEDVNNKPSASSTSAWEKATAQAEDQWQEHQTPDVQKSSWDTKSAWEKSPDVSGTTLWSKNSSPSSWESDALYDRESAAGYAATGPAQYGQETSVSAWQGKPSNNGWQKNSQSAESWAKDSSPSRLYDAPSKWDSKPKGGNSEWQKGSSAWDSSSDYNTWQKETSGWTDSPINVQNHPAVNGWQQGSSHVTTQKPWQQDSISSVWQKSATAISNNWGKHGLHLSKMVK